MITNMLVTFQVYLATGAPISKPDSLATNGIVHVIDDVMFLPVRTSAEVINASPDLSGVAQLFNVTGLSQDLISGKLHHIPSICLIFISDTRPHVGGVHGLLQCSFNSAQVQLSTNLPFFKQFHWQIQGSRQGRAFQ